VNKIYYLANYTSRRYTIYENGTDCESLGICTPISCTGNTLIFNVTQFSSFAAGILANLSIWDTSDQMIEYINQPFDFYANYTNATGIINNSVCQIRFNVTGNWTNYTAMTYDSSIRLYQYNMSFVTAGNYTFHVLCNGSASGYDILNATDNFTVSYIDDTPPTISSLVVSVTNVTADITFNTDDSSNSSLSYGNLTNFTVTLSNSALATSHTFNLTIVNPNTTYYYNVTACNNYGFCTENGTLNFTTSVTPDTTAPTITIAYPTNDTDLSNSTIWTWVNITTDEAATCKFATTNASFPFATGTLFNTTGGTAHSLNYTVAENNTYSLYYRCNDSANINTPGTYHTFDVNATPIPDTTAPVISAVLNSSVTNVSSTITWTTDEAATTVFKYGTTSGTYGTTTTNSSTDTSHTVSLTGLTSETTYYYVVNSSDAAGNSDESSEYSFTTLDLTPPSITSVAESGITGTAATITWTTDESATSAVRYGTSSGTYTLDSTSTSTTTSHSRSISSLSDGTTYYYVVVSNDTDGNSAQSSQGSFATTDSSAPVITFTSPVNVTTTITSIVDVPLTVTTSEAATCYANTYLIGSSATTTDVYLTPANANNLSHSATFDATGESSGYSFYFTVNCKDADTNSRTSTVYFALDDTTLPVATFTSPTPAADGYVDNDTLDIRFSVSETMYSGYPRISIDNGTNTSLSVSNGYYTDSEADLDDGRHGFTVYLLDSYGNERAYTRLFTVDTEEPDIDETLPDDGASIANCMEVVLNVTLSEEGTCEFTIYEDEQDKYDDCIDECSEDEDDCDEDADTSAERTECDDDREVCDDDCEDDRYDEIKNDDLEEEYELEDCEEKCDNVEDDCEDVCKDTRSTCSANAVDSDDRDDCGDDYDDCEEDCSDDKDDCYEDCVDDAIYTYIYEYDTKCFKDADYMITYVCEDLSGNQIEENVTFTMKDTTAPEIIELAPNGTITSTTADIRATTDENAFCKFAMEDVAYADMNLSFFGATKIHTFKYNNLENDDYVFYVRCNDTGGNVMTSSGKIAFTVDSSGAVSSASASVDQVSIGEKASFTISKTDIAVTKIDITVNADVSDATVDVKKITDTSNIKQPSKPVYQYLQITKEGISNKQIDTVTVDFKVPLTWIDSNSMKSGDISLYKYTTKWEEISTKKISEDGNYVYYEATTNGFSVFAILGQESVTTTTDTTDTNANADTTTSVAPPDETEQPEEDQPIEMADEGGSYTWLIILLCVLVVGGGTAGFFVYKSHRHPQQDSETVSHQPLHEAAVDEQSSSEPAHPAVAYPDDEVAQFIYDSSNEGQTVDAIRDALTASGYTVEDVNVKLTEMGLLDELGDYIRAAIDAGQNMEEIQESLLETGYGPQDIVNKFTEMGLNESDGQLEQYVSECMSAGMSLDEIKQNLSNAGHDDATVNALVDVQPATPADTGASQAETDKQVLDYIKSSVEFGMTPEQITEQLINEGHEEGYVHALVAHGAKAAKPKSEVFAKPAIETKPQQPVQQPKPQVKPVAKPAKQHDEVLDYIKKARSEKVPKRLVLAALVKAGHTKKEINKRYAEISAVEKKFQKDIKAYIKAEKKQKTPKKLIKEGLVDMGADDKTIKRFLK